MPHIRGTDEGASMDHTTSAGDGHARDGEGEPPLGRSLWRGWRMRCPRCGEGRMLRAYLKVRDACPACGEPLHHARADDGPAYLTILVVGHLMAPAILFAYPAFRPSPLVTATVFSVACVALSLALLPRFKGVIVAVQWRSRLGGFGERSPAR